MTTLRTFTPNLEVYSIDEAFLDLRGMDWDLEDYGDQIKAAVFKNQGIPTCGYPYLHRDRSYKSPG
jgi:DNA polymerase V